MRQTVSLLHQETGDEMLPSFLCNRKFLLGNRKFCHPKSALHEDATLAICAEASQICPDAMLNLKFGLCLQRKRFGIEEFYDN